jgi:hypothetical protein
VSRSGVSSVLILVVPRLARGPNRHRVLGRLLKGRTPCVLEGWASLRVHRFLARLVIDRVSGEGGGAFR